MRILKNVILGLLMRKPMSGYDITKAFEHNLGYLWHANHSQIYPELKKLTDEGLVKFETKVHGEKMEVKKYTITPQGRSSFEKWIRIIEPTKTAPRDVFRLRIFLSDSLSKEEIVHHMSAQLRETRSRLEFYEEKLQLLYDRPFDEFTLEERGDFFTLSGGILRDRAAVEWLENSIALLRGKPEGKTIV